jgi:hypothetical protein
MLIWKRSLIKGGVRRKRGSRRPVASKTTAGCRPADQLLAQVRRSRIDILLGAGRPHAETVPALRAVYRLRNGNPAWRNVRESGFHNYSR